MQDKSRKNKKSKTKRKIKVGLDFSFLWYGISGLSIDTINIYNLLSELPEVEVIPLVWDSKSRVNEVINPYENFNNYLKLLGKVPTSRKIKLKTQFYTLLKLLTKPKAYFLKKEFKGKLLENFKIFENIKDIHKLEETDWLLIDPSANIFYEVAKYFPARILNKIFKIYNKEIPNIAKLDIVIYQYPRFVKFKDAKHIVKIHDLIPLYYPEEKSAYNTLKFALDKLISENWDFHYITPTKHVKKELTLYSAYFKPRTTVIYNTIQEPPKKLYSKEEIYKKLQIPADYKYFIQVGTIQPNKNHKLTFKAFLELIKKTEKVKLVLVGGIRLMDKKTKELYNILKNKGIIIHLANIDRKLHFSLIKHAVALLFPSEHEGFGLPPVEALSVGTIPIVKENEVFREVIGEKGVYVRDEGDMVKKLTRLLASRPPKKLTIIEEPIQKQKIIEEFGNLITQIVNQF